MSCDAAAAAASIFFAAWNGPDAPKGHLVHLLRTADAPLSVAKEPLFADIVGQAGRLQSKVEALRAAKAAPDAAFRADVSRLSALDMQGHVTLKERGTDGDLKCILRGISQDLPVKMKDLADATDDKSRDKALRELSYLLRDNVEVITTPASVTSGT
jgi:hypothetical protein